MGEIIDYIPDHFIGKVIGRGGSMRKRIENETGALLTVQMPERIVRLKGSAEQKESANQLIKQLLVSDVSLSYITYSTADCHRLQKSLG